MGQKRETGKASDNRTNRTNSNSQRRSSKSGNSHNSGRYDDAYEEISRNIRNIKDDDDDDFDFSHYDKKNSGSRKKGTGSSGNYNHTKKKKKQKKVKKHAKLRLAIKLIFLFILLVILAGLIAFYFKYGDEIIQWQTLAKEEVDASSESTFKSSLTSLVYSSNGKVITKLKKDKDAYYLTSDQIPQSVKDAFVVTEDRDFYTHSGIRLKSIAVATIYYAKSKVLHKSITRGGSTITQQLARGVFLKDYSKTAERKVKEMFLAIELEKKYNKKQILEFYINNVYFANGYYGIEAAARGYFSKSASDLDLSEIAFLCSIPNNPTRYNPFEHFKNTISRKKRILNQMLQEKVINAAEYNDAYYEDIVLDPPETIKEQDYFTTYAVNCATKALMKAKGFKFRYSFDSDEDEDEYDENYDDLYTQCNKALYTGGYQVYTSLNKKIQKKLQKTVNEKLAGFTTKTKKVYDFQGAATCIDNSTGKVVAIVGGRSQKLTSTYSLNRAYQSFRQPGSSFKPIAVYTPQLERDYTPDSIVDDTFFKGGPKDSDGTYLGKITLRKAVEKSKNVVAWKLFQELTPSVGLSYILKMDFTRIVSSDYVPAASLGGLTNGVTTVEMASAYATLANEGKFTDPTCIEKITDSEGNTIVSSKLLSKKKQVYKQNATLMMTDILEGVLKEGTAAGYALSNMACAGKTGTTSDKKDGWFCGFTPYYTTAVWVGYDTPKTVDNLYGSTYPLYIWHDFMEELHSGLTNKAFTAYTNSDGSLSSATSSPSSSKLPSETLDPEAAQTTPSKDANSTSAAATPEPTEYIVTTTENPDDVGTEDETVDVGN